MSNPKNQVPTPVPKADPRPDLQKLPGRVLEVLQPDRPGAYSIRMAEKPGRPCVLCGAKPSSGPTGYRDDEPVCDRCLLKGSTDLGLVLALVSVARRFAAIEPPDGAQARQALSELGGFVRIVERVARRWGPPHAFDLSDDELPY